jgi:hypothetical protein
MISASAETPPNASWRAGHPGAAPATKFGAREANTLPDGPIYSSSAAMVFAMSFVVMIGGLLIYQFLIVPHYAPYTR